MFDSRLRSLIDPPLNRLGERIARAGISANAITVAGFLIGMSALPFIAAGWFALAALLVAISRLADGLDGAVARATKKTDFGGFLDIVLDFIFYGAVPLAFALHAPETNALPCAVLLLSFFANGTTFLAYATIAAKRAMETTAQGIKSLYYMVGLAEGAETIAFLIAICLFPEWFPVLAYIYATLCFASAAGRIALASQTLADEPEAPAAPTQDAMPLATPGKPAPDRE